MLSRQPTLHLACLPYPTFQGTQALLHQILSALCGAEHDAQLLVYPEGQPLFADSSYKIHRGVKVPLGKPGFRSGPSLRKIALDVGMLRELNKRSEGRVVVAHNVEAALLVRAAGIRKAIYYAHTVMETELPSYGRQYHRLLGRTLDRASLAACSSACAVSPYLAERLAIPYVPAPWVNPNAPMRSKNAKGILYAGNLDGYQGWEDLLYGFSLLPTALRIEHPLCIATASDPSPALQLAKSLNITLRLKVLGDESIRSMMHRDTRLVIVPRRAEGGVPIKLLDALARKVPVVASHRALAGLPLRSAVTVVQNDSPKSMADGIVRALRQDPINEIGAKLISEQHSSEAFLRAFDILLARHIAQSS